MRTLVVMLALLMPGLALAQAPRDCGSLWKEADSDANGTLDREEDQRGYFDAFLITGHKPLEPGRLSRDEFMVYCEGSVDRSSAGTLQHKGAEGPIDRGKGDLTPGLIPFPKDEAKRRVQALGYRDIGEFVLDAQGIWRTSATMNGKTVQVSVDVQGEVLASG
jgi:hypothetical protein